jgi:siroheme synthase-like protein
MHSDQLIPETPSPATKTGNNLLPIFLKLENLRLLIVGGGNVGLEKLNTVLQNSPSTIITLVATTISEEIREVAAHHQNIELIERAYQASDLDQVDVVISAVNSKVVSESVWSDAKEKGKLINVADTPELCDFYLGSVVKKGNLKIAISTNGQSPTIAKRLKELFSEVLPDQLNEVLDNMQVIRSKLNGNLNDKVKVLNEITKVLAAKQITLDEIKNPGEKKWQQIVKWCLFAFFFMLLGHALLSLIPFSRMPEGV